MNSNYLLIEIFCCINSNFDPGNTPNQIYPSLAINEMCNYITACSCHLENWYFVTHFDSFLLPLTLLTSLSLSKMFIKIKYRVKIIRKKNGSSLHTLALLVSLHFFCHVSCDRSFTGLTYSTIILSLTEW